MSSRIKAIEKKWIENFRKSLLVDSASGVFNKTVAHALYYGSREGELIEHLNNFKQLYGSLANMSQDESIVKLCDFLHFVGIKVDYAAVEKHLILFPVDYEKFKTKCYFIIRTLAHKDESLLLTNPFGDIYGDIYFLLRIHTGESVKGGQLNIFEEVNLPEFYNRFDDFPDGYEDNETIKQLFNDIENSSQSYFITGKAGTGKSTFLHYYKKKTKKKVIVLAFTGIAAINVGGQTIHSFFKFPFDRALEPDDYSIPIFEEWSNIKKVIKQVDAILIDEVSMLRSDVLEAISYSLRMNGGDMDKIFGGKQLLFFGDIFQLPPVTQEATDEEERTIFNKIYESKYFFHSPSYQKLNPVFTEFKISYRQKDDSGFVDILNDVRECKNIESTISKLNGNYIQNYEPKKDEFIIMLSARTDIANNENINRLRALPEPTYYFNATVEGVFEEKRFPTNRSLELKQHAQIILIKNDSRRRWVNGTIAKIHFIANNVIEIILSNGDRHELQREIWENRKTVRGSDGKLKSQVIGTFTQYPIKLAWAVTVHKSQGLTFDNVVIDMGTGAFVNGQLYTALSRCRTLSGIVLRQKLRNEDIIVDHRVFEFYKRCIS